MATNSDDERSKPMRGIRQLYEKYLQTRCDKLKVCQMVLGVTTMIANQQLPFPMTVFETFLNYLGFNVPLLTALLLWDIHNGNRLQTSLQLHRFTNHPDLHFQALAATLYYVVSFWVLATFYVGDYHPFTDIEAGIFGVLTSLTHGYNWWLLFRERSASRKNIREITF